MFDFQSGIAEADILVNPAPIRDSVSFEVDGDWEQVGAG
jgi:hypothetical protein